MQKTLRTTHSADFTDQEKRKTKDNQGNEDSVLPKFKALIVLACSRKPSELPSVKKQNRFGAPGGRALPIRVIGS